jgi:hypothetical protein
VLFLALTLQGRTYDSLTAVYMRYVATFDHSRKRTSRLQHGTTVALMALFGNILFIAVIVGEGCAL